MLAIFMKASSSVVLAMPQSLHQPNDHRVRHKSRQCHACSALQSRIKCMGEVMQAVGYTCLP